VNPLNIIPAEEKDVPLILEFIRALADYEKLSAEVSATEAGIRESLFGARPAAECLIAYWEDKPAGFALTFRNFSTFLGRPGLYLEDLFVRPEFRGKGIGKALLVRLANQALESGCGRFEWAVLDWNKPAIAFYRGLDGKPMEDWTVFRMGREELERLARS
jgi:GNAT superfamily N-acetyltransferase